MSAAMKALSAGSEGTTLSGGPVISPKFHPFTINDIVYKHVRGTPLSASVLIPKDIKPGRHPLAVRWHGGFLATGHRLFADWYPQFLLDFCLKHDAVAVTVDYRLMPEANGLEILDDVRDLYPWLFTTGNLSNYLPHGVEVDLDHVLVTGESAGGWLAFQSPLVASEPERFAVVVMHYPMLDLRDRHYTEKYEKKIFSPPAPQFPEKVLQEFLGNLKGNEVVTGAMPPERVPVVVSIIQQGRTADFLGQHPSLYPLEILTTYPKPTLPPMWLLHGKQDSAVPIEGSYKFLEKLKEKGLFDEEEWHLTFEDGEHGFDNHAADTGEPATLQTEWVKPGIDFLEKFWPRR